MTGTGSRLWGRLSACGGLLGRPSANSRRRAAVRAKMSLKCTKRLHSRWSVMAGWRDMHRSFDIAYWHHLGPAAIFEAAWQMAVDAHVLQPGDSHELRLRRTVENFQPQRS